MYLPFANKYCIYRCDRAVGVGGGVAVLIPRSIPSVSFQSIETYDFESLTCKVTVSKVTIAITVVYRPPRPHKPEMPQNLIDYLDRSINKNEPNLIFGDFNYSGINWLLGTSSKQNGQHIFMEYFQVAGFKQLVDFPTREENLLDLIFSNENNLLQSVHKGLKISSDHETITANLNVQYTKTQYTLFRDFQNSNFQAISRDISKIKWNQFFEGLSVNDMWNKFVHLLSVLVETHVPLRTISIKNNCPNTSIKVKKLCRKAYELHKKWKSTNSHIVYQKYLEASKIAQRAKREADFNSENKILESANLNKFWNFVNSKLTYKSSIPSLLDINLNRLIHDNQIKAEMLNDYFCSVFTIDDGKQPTWAIFPKQDKFCTEISCTPDLVFQKLKKISPKQSCGIDGISSFFLKSLREVVSIPLSAIFNKSFKEGVVPKQWKLANITAIFKKGDQKLCNNYRPISLTCIASRVCESIVADKIKDYIKNEIYSGQHGFIANKSTVTQLFETYEKWVLYVDKHKSIDGVYIDFAKAFDSVIHTKLLSKLYAYGIRGQLLDWIAEFLKDRKQRVNIGGELSAIGKVTSGVPQGSVLGPLLFLIFINDLPNCIGDLCEVNLFADDCKLFLVHDEELNKTTDLQLALDKLQLWAESSQLSIQPDKCEVLYIGKKNKKRQYTLNNAVLPAATVVKDLGVHMTDTLKFDTHIAKIVQSASNCANLILKSFKSKKPQFMIKLFNTFVRSKLEYASPIWNPHTKSLIAKLEKVQRKFTKRLPGLQAKSYEERLRILKITTLEERRLKLDLCFLFKVIKGKINVNFENYFEYKSNITRGHSLSLRERQSNSDLKRFSFAQRIVKVWNFLPETVINAPSVASFKKQLDKVELGRFLRGWEPRSLY